MAKKRRRSRRLIHPPPPPGIKYKDAAEALCGIKGKEVGPPGEPVVLLEVAIDLIKEAIKQIGPKTRKRRKKK